MLCTDMRSLLRTMLMSLAKLTLAWGRWGDLEREVWKEREGDKLEISDKGVIREYGMY